jgi:4'-phosphopantetheinyl transferase EntD
MGKGTSGMELKEYELEQALSAALGVSALVAVASEPATIADLTPAELDQFGPLAATPRRGNWLLGRAALKKLLGRLGEPPDTAPLVFPHQRLSLTHSGAVAVALGVKSPGLAGVGVDLEWDRTPRREVSRFFLIPAEEDWLGQQAPAEQPGQLLRLWTVKEALFKADPHNRHTSLLDYCLPAPGAACGAALGSAALPMRYASLLVAGGFISAALAREMEVRGC